jgi:hypothetical protein
MTSGGVRVDPHGEVLQDSLHVKSWIRPRTRNTLLACGAGFLADRLVGQSEGPVAT